jgi:hypothetical protein
VTGYSRGEFGFLRRPDARERRTSLSAYENCAFGRNSSRSEAAEPSENSEFAVSTRTYIVLAALTGLAILVAFTFQVVLANR